MNPLSEYWRTLSDSLDFAFQPIVNIHTGAVYGFEALLRGTDRAGFPSIHQAFDAAYEDGVLYPFDYRLREKALTSFREIGMGEGVKLFYNLDNRVTEMPDYSPGNTQRLLEEFGFDPSSIVFEVSERYEFSDYNAARRVLDHYKGQDFRIAVDDFGAGYSGLQLLYFAQPDLIKIDRFFVEGIDGEPRKRQFAAQIVNMAHLLGIQVVAEGVETEREFHACRKIGCDLVQGYLIAPPHIDRTLLSPRYTVASDLVRADRRSGSAVSGLLRSRVNPIPPVRVGDDIMTVLERFRHGSDGGTPPAAIPALDAVGTCVGLLRERDFRRYVYSPFGIALLRHAALSQPFGGLLVPVPVADIHADLRVVQDLFLGSPDNEGVVVSEDGKYAGFLDARSILEAVSEKELSDARDQNPLSKLPGNPKLEEYLASRWEDPAADCLFCYFDFNDFKPFNDRYGFRRGDRVILLFADILRDIANRRGWFVAHIGGDDFFAGIDIVSERGLAEAEQWLDEAIERFAGSVAAFYDEPDRSRGWIEGRDRNDELRPFPLLSVIGARYRRKPGPPEVPLEAAGELFARLKKEAKRSKPVAAQNSIALIPQLY